MNEMNDIEDFTVEQMREEIARREGALARGLCWYCGKQIESHTCKHSQQAMANSTRRKP
jgi:hypothetical protein